METKHTPGPWNYDGTWALIKSDCGAEICAVHGAREFRAKPETHKGEALANALLMAAAPELLAALQYMLLNAEALGWSEAMCSDARAAIAKACGNQGGE